MMESSPEWLKTMWEKDKLLVTNNLLRAISPFPTVFLKDLYCRQVKRMACLGKGFATIVLKCAVRVSNQFAVATIFRSMLDLILLFHFDFDYYNIVSRRSIKDQQ